MDHGIARTRTLYRNSSTFIVHSLGPFKVLVRSKPRSDPADGQKLNLKSPDILFCVSF